MTKLRPLWCAVLMAALAIPAQAGWFDKALKDTMRGLGEKGVDESGDAAYDKAKDVLSGKEEEPSQPPRATETAPRAEPQTAGTAPKTSPGAVPAQATASAAYSPAEMKLFTKYDFVPGSQVLFFDDLGADEEGEFPYRWDLEKGVFEIARFGGESWILCSNDGRIRPRFPDGPLPEQYTVEFELYDHGPKSRANYHTLEWVDEGGRTIGSTGVYAHRTTFLALRNRSLADKRVSGPFSAGVHTYRVMATRRSIKAYLDNVRVANVPKVEGFAPVGFRIHARATGGDSAPWLMRNFRFAAGGKPFREQLAAEGRIVTHGILFDSGSATLKGESYRTLRRIGDLLTEDPELALSVEGHTDSQGSEAANDELSQARAQAVCRYLTETCGVEPLRLAAKGWGERQPLDRNDSPEGRANNRRVEFVAQ